MPIRELRPSDVDAVVAMRCELWPDGSAESHRAEVLALIEGRTPGILPLACFVVDEGAGAVAFLDASLRSHADGCDPARPVGFIEGWFVADAHRGKGHGRALIEVAAAWARRHGCRELASDTWSDDEASERAHRACGFEVVDRCINFRRSLDRDGAPGDAGADRETEPAPASYYGPDLARLHHEHFGAVARGAAAMLLERLRAAGFERGTVVDLAAGSGILSRAVAEAGFTPFGVDISESMLDLARELGRGTQLVHGSLWDVELPPCVAVTAVGEAFCYATDPTAGLEALGERLRAIHRALQPGGLLLFDVAGPGRSGPTGARHVGWQGEHHAIVLDESEDAGARELTRHIATFVSGGSLYRRVDELHVLRLYPPEEVEALLGAVGFDCERLDGYGGYPVLPGWHVFAARRSGTRAA